MKPKLKDRKNRKMHLEEHDTSKTLGNPEIVFAAFMDCLQEGDHVAAREILAGGLRHMNKSKLSRSHRIPRRTLYNLFDSKSAPGLDLVAKVCRAIRQESARRTDRRS
jgi:DNA-binding phage protein